jgi:hypothetical protein
VGDDVCTVSAKSIRSATILGYNLLPHSVLMLFPLHLFSLFIGHLNWRIHCCMFLFSLFREASSKVVVWTYIGNWKKKHPKSVVYIHIESIPAMLVISLSAVYISRRRHFEVGYSAEHQPGHKGFMACCAFVTVSRLCSIFWILQPFSQYLVWHWTNFTLLNL